MIDVSNIITKEKKFQYVFGIFEKIFHNPGAICLFFRYVVREGF